VLMRSTSCFLAAVAALLSLVAPAAQAADTAPRPNTRAVPGAEPPPEVASAWDGLHAGASMGFRSTQADWTTGVPPLAGTGPGSVLLDSLSLRGGAYIGYDWQVAPRWVVGIAADWAWANDKMAIVGIPGTPAAAGTTDKATITERWDAGLRGRVGLLATANWLVYATGGVTWQSLELAAACSPAGGFCLTDRSEAFRVTRTGWSAGAGMERSFLGNWLARAEYRYADFGRMSTVFFAGTGNELTAGTRATTHTGLIGIAYRFGSAPAAVAARN
jgi:outer membrane immunogenic protein